MILNADSKISNPASMKGSYQPSGDAFWDKCLQ